MVLHTYCVKNVVYVQNTQVNNNVHFVGYEIWWKMNLCLWRAGERNCFFLQSRKNNNINKISNKDGSTNLYIGLLCLGFFVN